MKLLIFINILLIVVFAAKLIEINLKNNSDKYTLETADLTGKLDRLDYENAHLRELIYHYSSYRDIASRAGEFGFHESNDMIFLQ